MTAVWLAAGLLVLALGSTTPAHAAACVEAEPACAEWIGTGTSAGRLLIYRTHPLEARNASVTRALITIHGAGRNADGYFRSSVAAAFLAGALENTVVISPRFAGNDGTTCKDAMGANELNWRCVGVAAWRTGGAAVSDESVTSYALADELLRKLARRDIFPALRAIVVAGHSAGGQFVSRYAMANTVHDGLGVPVTYVVSNPSSYAYLDERRPAASGELQAFADRQNCTTYDHWPYGLQQRNGYAAKVADAELKTRLVARPVTYLLGGLDTLPIAGFDSSCPAMAQGPTRLARGQTYAKYINDAHGAKHPVLVIPLCGHSARCMFTADPALPLLFPKP